MGHFSIHGTADDERRIYCRESAAPSPYRHDSVCPGRVKACEAIPGLGLLCRLSDCSLLSSHRLSKMGVFQSQVSDAPVHAVGAMCGNPPCRTLEQESYE